MWKSLAFRVIVAAWALAIRAKSGHLPAGVTVGAVRVRLWRWPPYALWRSVWPPDSQTLRRPEREPSKESAN